MCIICCMLGLNLSWSVINMTRYTIDGIKRKLDQSEKFIEQVSTIIETLLVMLMFLSNTNKHFQTLNEMNFSLMLKLH